MAEGKIEPQTVQNMRNILAVWGKSVGSGLESSRFRAGDW